MRGGGRDGANTSASAGARSGANTGSRSENIDAWQDRGCMTCGLFENWVRSDSDAAEKISRWAKDRSYPPAPAHRSLTAEADPVERALLEEIYADPDADHARSVYADWLIARGDPLGEFIAAQVARAAAGRGEPSRSERALFEEHWRAWVGPPAEIVAPYKIEFERGLWSACDVLDPGELGRTNPRELERAFAAPSWSTVRRLGLPRYLEPSALELLAGPLRRSLASLHIASPELLAGLAAWERAPLALRELVYAHDRFGAHSPLPRAFEGAITVARLRVVDHHEDPARWIELATGVPGLGELELELRDRQRPADLRGLLARADASPLARFVIGLPPVFAHARRTPAGTLAYHRLELRPAQPVIREDDIVRVSRLVSLFALDDAPPATAGLELAIPALGEDLAATSRLAALAAMVRHARVVRTPAPVSTAIALRRR